MSKMKLFTIGFTQRTARDFFTGLLDAGVRRVVDVRLANTSQLAGFAKSADLAYFLEATGEIDYLHLPELAPTRQVLDKFKKDGGTWCNYRRAFRRLLTTRRVEEKMKGILRDGDCLLCSEPEPRHCHRRLVAEYLQDKWGEVEVCHL